MAASEITFGREGIANLLRTGRFKVPKYQREFKWESDHIRELFDDIENAIADDEPEYFLGSIVTSNEDSDRPEIVDGQQRLATISILLAAIRDYYVTSGDPENALHVEREYLLQKDPVTKAVTPRLQLGDADNEFFEKAILGKPGSSERDFKAMQKSHKRMEAAQKQAAEYVKKIVLSGNNPDKQIFSRVDYIPSPLASSSFTCRMKCLHLSYLRR